MPKLIAPSPTLLQIKIDAAMAAFDAHRKDVLTDRFERAAAFNRRRARERHEANLVRMPRSSGYKVPR